MLYTMAIPHLSAIGDVDLKLCLVPAVYQAVRGEEKKCKKWHFLAAKQASPGLKVEVAAAQHKARQRVMHRGATVCVHGLLCPK